jgi:hypothetical protein
MLPFMRTASPSPFFAAAVRGRVELVLQAEDGSEWTLSVSPGVEQFIGYYPRICGIASPEGPLLAYRACDCG